MFTEFKEPSTRERDTSLGRRCRSPQEEYSVMRLEKQTKGEGERI